MIKLLKEDKLDIDVVFNPEGNDYVDMIFRNFNGRITGWYSLNKEQVEAVIEELQRKLVEL